MADQIHAFSVGRSTAHSVQFGNTKRPALICGPCVIESRDHILEHAASIAEIASRSGYQLVFKSSYDKANRTAISGFRGVGIEKGLQYLSEVRERFNVPILTDVHTVEEVKIASQVVDVLQVPAFLCRQTDLLLACGESGKAVNVKKGQFLHPADMKFAAEKISSTGNRNIVLCERGSTFGYRELVVDFRGLIIMREFGYPVCFDATHSVQSMGGAGGKSGGDRRFVRPLLRAAVAVGVDAIFIEAHRDPDHAPSDGPNMLPLTELSAVLKEIEPRG